MSDSALATTTENGQTTPSLPEEPLPWPAMMAFLTAWLFPATTARRTRTVPLLHAYGVHLLAAVATFFLVVTLVGIDEGRDPITIFANDVLREFDRNWQEALLITMVIAFATETGFLVLALIVLPWGAGDEPLRSSCAHALRHTWLHSTHALPAVLAVGLLVVGHDRIKRDYYSSPGSGTPPAPTYNMPSPPTCPANPTTQQTNDYQKALADWQKKSAEANQEYVKAWQAYQQTIPFLIRYGEVFIIHVGFLVGFWVLWALFRAAGTPRPIVPIQRPPTCEFCGYNLVATPVDSRCPECGELVTSSLGPNVRPGPAWQRRREVGIVRAWWECESQPILAPTRFGRTVRVCPSDTAHRLFLVGHLPIVFVVTGIAMILSCLVAAYGAVWEEDSGIVLWGIAPIVAMVSMCSWLFLTMLAAALLGIMATLMHKRNLLPASVQIASYLAGYLTIWACCSAAWSVVSCALLRRSFFDAWLQPYGFDPEFLAFCFWALPTGLGFLLGYVVLLWKATTSTRYANR